MTDQEPPRPHPAGAGRYEIRLAGRLDVRWTAWFDGLSVLHATDGTTRIAGPVPDQAALHGLLGKVRDLGLPLLSVVRLDPAPDLPSPDLPPGTTPTRSTP